MRSALQWGENPEGFIVSRLPEGIVEVYFLEGDLTKVIRRRRPGHVREEILYKGLNFGPLECERLVLRLRTRPAMLLRNNGSLVCGRSIGEAFVLMAALDKACEIQLLAQASGAHLHTPPAAVCRQAQMELGEDTGLECEVEWAALLRKLDSMDATYRG